MFAFHKITCFTSAAMFLLLGQFIWVATAQANTASDNLPTVLAAGQKPPKGLTSLFTVKNGIHGSYELNGRIVNFETRRGPRTPKYLRMGDPDTPNFEIDVRFFNRTGKSILVQIGGSAPQDKAWTADLADFTNDSEAMAEFELATKAVRTIKKLKFKRHYIHERRALVNLIPTLESAQVMEKEEGVPGIELNAQTTLVNYNKRHRIQIHHKRILFNLARHSATIGKFIAPTGAVTTAVITCNHGTCANHSSMTLKCLWTSAWPGDRNNSLKNWVSCSTPYNATSFWGHNSNDDTDLQYKAVRYNYRPSFTDGVCNDSSPKNEPTGCY